MQDSTPRLSAVEVEELGHYQPLSKLAIAAAILGGLSFLAIFSIAAWILPVMGVLTGAAAVRAIRRNESSLSGTRLASCGIGLCLFFGGWGATWFLSEQWLITRQARQYSYQWLDLVRRGELYRAHQLRLPIYDRQPAGSSLAEFYSGPAESETVRVGTTRYELNNMLTPRQELEQFFGSQPLDKIIDLGTQTRLVYDGSVLRSRDAPLMIGMRWTVVYQEEGQQRLLPLTVVMQRFTDPETGQQSWSVNRVVDRILELEEEW